MLLRVGPGSSAASSSHQSSHHATTGCMCEHHSSRLLACGNQLICLEKVQNPQSHKRLWKLLMSVNEALGALLAHLVLDAAGMPDWDSTACFIQRGWRSTRVDVPPSAHELHHGRSLLSSGNEEIHVTLASVCVCVCYLCTSGVQLIRCKFK